MEREVWVYLLVYLYTGPIGEESPSEVQSVLKMTLDFYNGTRAPQGG